MTEKAKSWRLLFTSETKLLNAEADNIMSKFSELEKAKIAANETIVLELLHAERINNHIREEFISRPELKITLSGWLTDKGSYTKKTKELVADIVNGELENQRSYDARCNTLKIKCL